MVGGSEPQKMGRRDFSHPTSPLNNEYQCPTRFCILWIKLCFIYRLSDPADFRLRNEFCFDNEADDLPSPLAGFPSALFGVFGVVGVLLRLLAVGDFFLLFCRTSDVDVSP